MLCAKILRVPTSHGPVYQVFERALNGLSTWYGARLRWALSHPLMVGGMVTLLALGAFGTALTLKREFIPADDRGVIFTNVIAPEGSTLAYTDRYQRMVEEVMGRFAGD
jgi:multidrug efflux pump